MSLIYSSQELLLSVRGVSNIDVDKIHILSEEFEF